MQQRRTPCIFLKLEQPILTLSCGISLNTLVFSLIRDCCVVRSSIDILLDPGLHKIIDRIQIWVAEGPQVCVQDVLHVRPASHPILLHCIFNKLELSMDVRFVPYFLLHNFPHQPIDTDQRGRESPDAMSHHNF